MKDTATVIAWREKLARMDEAERKAYITGLSMRQEETCVASLKKSGYLAWRIAKEHDIQAIPPQGGEVWIIDCKYSNEFEFIVERQDIIKLFEVADEISKRLGIPTKVKIDMWFPRTRRGKNRRFISLTHDDIGKSVFCTKTEKTITTRRSGEKLAL